MALTLCKFIAAATLLNITKTQFQDNLLYFPPSPLYLFSKKSWPLTHDENEKAFVLVLYHIQKNSIEIAKSEHRRKIIILLENDIHQLTVYAQWNKISNTDFNSFIEQQEKYKYFDEQDIINFLNMLVKRGIYYKTEKRELTSNLFYTDLNLYATHFIPFYSAYIKTSLSLSVEEHSETNQFSILFDFVTQSRDQNYPQHIETIHLNDMGTYNFERNKRTWEEVSKFILDEGERDYSPFSADSSNSNRNRNSKDSYTDERKHREDEEGTTNEDSFVSHRKFVIVAVVGNAIGSGIAYWIWRTKRKMKGKKHKRKTVSIEIDKTEKLLE